MTDDNYVPLSKRKSRLLDFKAESLKARDYFNTLNIPDIKKL